jgi:cell shape-determining protein MreC
MNYLLKSSSYADRRRQSRQRVLLITLSLLVVLGVMITGPARRALFFIAQPIWQIKNSLVNSDLAEYFKSKKILIQEKSVLEEKLFLAGNDSVLNQILQVENENLKALLGRLETKQKTVLATILVRPPQTPYDSLIIDVGENFQIKVGDQVLANGNIYLGEVSEVFPRTAKINLYSTPGRKLTVELGQNPVTVEAVGVGGSNFKIFLPREVGVQIGDVIIVPSITPNVFGIVEKIDFREEDSFQTVLFRNPINLSELKFVEIII